MGAFYGVVSAEGCPTTSLPQKSVSIQNHVVDHYKERPLNHFKIGTQLSFDE